MSQEFVLHDLMHTPLSGKGGPTVSWCRSEDQCVLHA